MDDDDLSEGDEDNDDMRSRTYSEHEGGFDYSQYDNNFSARDGTDEEYTSSMNSYRYAEH